MITTILEVLVAVVVLIVIIAVAALRFLRADDSDTFDDMPDEPRRTGRHPAQPAAKPALVPAGRGRPRQPEPATEQWAAAGRGGRPAPKPDRHGGRAPSGPRPAPAPAMQAAARQPKAPRPTGADSGASDWDKLSDVDYWAELTSERPLNPAAPAAAASSGPSRSPRRGADQKGDARSAPRGEVAQLPLRQRSRSRSASAPRPADPGLTEQIDVRAVRSGGQYNSEPARNGLAALARLADQPPASSQPPGLPNGQRNQRGANGHPVNGHPVNGRPAGNGQRPSPAPDRRALSGGPSHSGGSARPPQPLDDDPLTSPSFPAVNASDSRSYRTRRSSGSQRSNSHPSSSQPANSPRPNGNGTGGYSDPLQPRSPLPPAPDRSSSLPNGYPVQPAAASAAGSSYSGSPVANPYGSYVNAPGHSGASTPSTPAPTPLFDAAAYGSGYAAGQQAVAGVNWYENPTYQPGHSAQAGGNGTGYLPGHNDQRGYGAPELNYGQDGYQGYSGYGGSGR